MSTPRNYHSILAAFMGFKHGREYTNDTAFNEDQLLAITPDDVCQYLNIRAYGEPTPPPAMRPLHARSTTLEYVKKALSSFMPQQSIVWDTVRLKGNPTRCKSVNKLISKVRCLEGVESSKARRPLGQDELIDILTSVRASQELGYSTATRCLLSSVATLQWQLMARVDDIFKMQVDHFTYNAQYPETLFCRVGASAEDVDDAPRQILLGSMDPLLCPLLNMACYLEMVEDDGYGREASFLYGDPTYHSDHRVVRRLLTESFSKCTNGNQLGTDSIRKGATGYSTRTGVAKEYVDARARNRLRSVNTPLEYADTCAAASLTGPHGPCFYVYRPGFPGISTAILVERMASSIQETLGSSIAKTLVLPLLWAAMEPTDAYPYELLPSVLKSRVCQAYVASGGSLSGLNPVRRVKIQVMNDNGQLQLVRMEEDQSAQEPLAQRPVRAAATPCVGSEFAVLRGELSAMQRQMADISDELKRTQSTFKTEFQKITDLLEDVIANQPASGQPRPPTSSSRPVVTSVVAATSPPGEIAPPRDRRVPVGPAFLSKRPKDLHQLWYEYVFGLNGAKPAREFTSQERGTNKVSYSRRKLFWDTVARLVRAGHTSDAAIEKIYAVYGHNQSVSTILLCLRADKQSGGDPALRV